LKRSCESSQITCLRRRSSVAFRVELVASAYEAADAREYDQIKTNCYKVVPILLGPV